MGEPHQHLLGERHQVLVGGVRLIELEHGELGVVARGHPLVAKDARELEDALVAAHHQALQVQLRGDAEVEVHVERVVVGDEGARGGAAGDRLHHRRLDLEVAARDEEVAQVADRARAHLEDAPRLRVDDEVEVALAVARLHVLEAVPLLGQRAERLGEQAELRRLERELAGAGAERAPGHADHVAQVEQAVDLEALVAQAVAARVDLEPPRPVLHLQEARLAEVAHRHHASRDRQRPRSGQLGLAQGGETRMHLGRRMVRTEVIRVRVDPPLPKRLELFPPDHDLLVVFGHAADVSDSSVFTG